MVNENEGYDSQEEGEYHFSDESANYEIEPEAGKTDTTTKTASSVLKGFSRYRRWVVAGVVGVVAVLAVYKMLTPGYTPQPTDFTQQTPKAAPQAIVAVKTPQPAASPAPQQPVAPAVPVVAAAPQAVAPVVPPAAQAVSPQQPPVVSQPTGSVTDRLAALEDQNTKLTNMLQVEYAQKISDYAAAEAAMQTKIQELNARVASMENVINQLNQLLQNSSKQASAAPSAVIPRGAADAAPSRATYSVQAIIPGRAWLKSDSGDTVTVAEGDILKGYGRIAKIDPYDGTVQIDTGGKTLTLSYGLSTDAS